MTTRIPAMAISLADQLKQRDAQIERLKSSLAYESAGRQAALQEAAELREQAARLVTLYAELETVKLGKANSEAEAANLRETLKGAKAHNAWLQAEKNKLGSAYSWWRLFQMANAAKRAAKRGNAKLRAALEHKIKTWDALCRCVDEFEGNAEYCHEYVQADDTAMILLKSAFQVLAPERQP